MSTIANAKVAHNYNRYNGYFFGCLQFNLRPQNLEKILMVIFVYDAKILPTFGHLNDKGCVNSYIVVAFNKDYSSTMFLNSFQEEDAL